MRTATPHLPIAALFAFALVATPAVAQVTIAVNSTTQEVTLVQPFGIANGNCTLGEAILAANARAVVDGCNGASAPGSVVTIDLLPGTYTFDQVGQNAIAASSLTSPFALPELTQPTVLRGNNAVLRRSPAPGTPSMGLLVLATDGMSFSASALRLEGGVRGLSVVLNPAGTIATRNGVSLSEFRLTDVVIASPLGTPFNVSVTALARLERVVLTGADLRTTRPSLSSSGAGAVVFEVIDSEFADARGGLNIQPGGQNASASVLVSGSRFLRNRGVTGAGLRVSSNQPGLLVTLQGNQFIDNFGTTGGAVEIQLGPDGAPAVVTSSNNLFRGNVATANGGGLRVNGTSPQGYRFSSTGDIFEGNAGTEGGALRLDGILAQPALIDRATFRDNAANSGAAVAFVGSALGTAPLALRLTRSTLVGNADTAGLGNLIFASGQALRIQVDNATIDGNISSNRLLMGSNSDGILQAEALTITRNSARSAIDPQQGAATLRNSVIADNDLSFACNRTGGGTLANEGGLFVQDATCDSPARAEDPLLSPLAANGGSTLNRIPLFGSPLLNSGVAPVLEPLFDQRSLQRTQFGATDIGAVESDQPVIFLSGFEPGN